MQSHESLNLEGEGRGVFREMRQKRKDSKHERVSTHHCISEGAGREPGAQECMWSLGAGKGPQLTTRKEVGPRCSNSKEGHPANTINEQERSSSETSADFCLQNGEVVNDV